MIFKRCLRREVFAATVQTLVALVQSHLFDINNTGIKNAIPILSNSTYLAQAGALLSISSNHESIGKLSAEIVTQVFDGASIESLSNDHIAQEVYVTLNRNTQKSIEGTLKHQIGVKLRFFRTPS